MPHKSDFLGIYKTNCIDGVMVSVLTSSVVDLWLQS